MTKILVIVSFDLFQLMCLIKKYSIFIKQFYMLTEYYDYQIYIVRRCMDESKWAERSEAAEPRYILIIVLLRSLDLIIHILVS